MLYQRPPKLFLGIGDVHSSDFGLGIRAAEIMSRLPLPGDIEVLDGGMLGVNLEWSLLHRDLVLVVDAIDAGAEPGTIFHVTPAQLEPLLPFALSAHDSCFLNAIDAARLQDNSPRAVEVFAVQVHDESWGMGLSRAVTESLDRVLGRVIERLGAPRLLLEQETSCVLDGTS